MNGHTADPSRAHPAGTECRLRVLDHSIAAHTLTTMRDKQTPPDLFRDMGVQLLLLLALEATRELPTRPETVDTSLGLHEGRSLAKPVVLLALNRHAIGLAHEMAGSMPGMHVGLITLDHSPGGKEIEARFHLNNMPPLDTAKVVLFDPVVSSGASLVTALRLLQRSGATDLTVVSFVASLPGLSHVQACCPEAQVWVAGIDTHLDPRRGPVPGLGDFAKRLYG